MGKKYQWASPEAIGRLTMVQLRHYLQESETEDSALEDDDDREIVQEFTNQGDLMDYVRAFRQRKGIPEPEETAEGGG